MLDQNDLKQIGGLLEENNKQLKKEIVDDIGSMVNTAFSGQEKWIREEFDKVAKELTEKPSKENLFDWSDERVYPLELDMDRVKYLHIDEWAKLPDQSIVSDALVDADIKKKAEQK